MEFWSLFCNQRGAQQQRHEASRNESDMFLQLILSADEMEEHSFCEMGRLPFKFKQWFLFPPPDEQYNAQVTKFVVKQFYK